MQPAPHHSTHHGVSSSQPTSVSAIAEVSAAASLQAQLAQAALLLAETRHHCQALLEAAQTEAADTIAAGRTTAERIIADARAQTTEVDVRERSSSMFGDLWGELGEDHDPDAFFDGFQTRRADDIFNR